MRTLTRILAGTLVAVFVLCGLAGCTRKSPYGQGFRFPLGAEPLQLDPQVAWDSASVTVLRSLMEGLTALDENGKAVPAAAQSWSVSADGRTYTFRLADAKWQTGDAVTASDFVYAWTRAQDPATHSPYSERFANIAAVTATEERTLTVTLKEADAAFPVMVADTPFFPCAQAQFEQSGGRYGLEEEYTASNGAFTLTLWSHGEYLILDKSETYHAADTVAPSRVRFMIETTSDPLAALKSGALDATSLTAAQAEQAKDEGYPLTALHDSVYALWFQTQNPLLQDAAVRRALRGAIAYERLAEEWAADDTVASGILPPDTRLADASYRETAPSLTAATAPAEFENLHTLLPAETLSTLTLLCADDAASVRRAQYVVQSWQKYLGAYVKLVSLPAEELEARVLVGNYELALYTHFGTSAQAEAALGAFCSEAMSGNLSRLANAEYDAAYAAACADGMTAQEAYALEAAVWDLCPLVPLAFPTHWFGTGKTVSGLRICPFAKAGSVTYDFRAAQKEG